ncbi:MAG: hypothetical protein ACYTFK_08025 [Planctomycetota bacterium]
MNKPVVFGILGFCILVSQVCAQPVPDKDDVSAQAEAAHKSFQNFMRQSSVPRLEYEYKESFIDQADRGKLGELAMGSSLELEKIYNVQDGLRKRIEDYEGDDWDLLYGQTGLWRKVCADSQQTLFLKAGVDYFTAFASSGRDRERILEDIVRRCKANGDKWGPVGHLLRAKTFELSGDNEAATEAIDLIYNSGDLSDTVYFEAEILKSRLRRTSSSELLKRLFARADSSSCADDFELHLRLAFLALRIGEAELLEKVVERWPQAKDFAGRVILSGIVDRAKGGLDAEELTIFEVQLATGAARQKGAGEYKELLSRLCKVERFQSPLLLYVAALAWTEPSPQAAVEYYLRAAKAQEKQKSGELDIEAVEIAKQGAQLAHRLYYEGSYGRGIAREMIDYYCRLGGKEIDETIRYLSTRLLSDEGRDGEADELLRKIARSGGKYSKQARLDLIIGELQKSPDDRSVRDRLKKELEGLISSAEPMGEQDRSARAEATVLYCQLLLDEDDQGCARKVLGLLSRSRRIDTERLAILKVGAFLRLNKLRDAVRELLKAAEVGGCAWSQRGVEALNAVLTDEIDQFVEEEADFAEHVDNCNRLAEYCLACVEGELRPAADLIAAEFAVLTADGDENKLAGADGILVKLASQGYDGDVGWVRCKARLLCARGEFAAACKAWGWVASAARTAGVSSRQSERWWRAKVHEIRCWGRLPDTTKADVAHAVDVLESSFSDISGFWAAKLKRLKNAAAR